ncbi:MAG: DNA polymerase IV [Candidatus Cloacimonetes bacterium]|jgi:DNA polymerase-4|nr:DNA polymerase IV [Candidatus Cloacimonadota bacterium]
MSTPRRILLVDCDQFFVQCARIADPDGAGRERLLLVGGTADQRGVVTSASYETRVYGVRSGMPTARALRLCPQAKVVPVPRKLCGEKSRAVRAVLERFAPLVEPASIDEAYLDLGGTERLYNDEPLADTARRIQDAVLRETDIAVSIGGGTSKLVAKLAVERAKPAGVHVVPPGREEAFLAGFKLADIPGVGPVFADELRAMGLVTVPQALCLDRESLIRRLGERRGEWLYDRIRGIDDRPVEPERVARQVSRDETFARDIDDDAELERELLALVVRLGQDLRATGVRARTITVRVRDFDFRNRSAGRTVAQPLESDRAIFAVARELLARVRKDRRVPARLLSVAASQLTDDEGAQQLALFEGETEAGETARDRQLARLADTLRDRFGPDAIRPGRLIDG